MHQTACNCTSSTFSYIPNVIDCNVKFVILSRLCCNVNQMVRSRQACQTSSNNPDTFDLTRMSAHCSADGCSSADKADTVVAAAPHHRYYYGIDGVVSLHSFLLSMDRWCLLLTTRWHLPCCSTHNYATLLLDLDLLLNDDQASSLMQLMRG